MPDPRLMKAQHDLANPLAAILAEAQLLLMRADEIPPDMVESLKAIESAAIRMRTLIKELGKHEAPP
jgi:signal transduction histidine kinase